MSGRVEGKKAFITGGAQGLGAAMARKLAAEGAVVSIADINYAGAQAVAAEIVAEHGEGAAFAAERPPPMFIATRTPASMTPKPITPSHA